MIQISEHRKNQEHRSREKWVEDRRKIKNILSKKRDKRDNQDKKLHRVSWGIVTFDWGGSTADKKSEPVKEYDGVSSNHIEGMNFLLRILGQTGERGQGYLTNTVNRAKTVVSNIYSWSPQVAWSLVPDKHKKTVANMAIDFLHRFDETCNGNITKLIDISLNETSLLKVVPREKVFILPGCGFGRYLRVNNIEHRQWIYKIKQSITFQGLVRLSSNPRSIL